MTIAMSYRVAESTIDRICRKKIWSWLSLWLFLLMPVSLTAQTPSLAGDQLGFDQPAATLAAAQAYVYRAYLDGGTTPWVLTVTCAGAVSPFVCSGPFPPLTTGTHTVQLTAAVVLPDGRSAESAKSTAFSFRLFAAPSSPGQLRIVPGP